MAITLKIIKTKPFEANGSKETHYTCAYKGRVFGVNTLRIPADQIKLNAEKNSLTISCDVEVTKNESVDPLTGQISKFLDIVQKMDLALSEF